MLCGRAVTLHCQRSSYSIQAPWNLGQHVRGYQRQGSNPSRWTLNNSKQLRRGSIQKPVTLLTLSSEEEAPSITRLWKPFIFTVAFSGCSFVGAAVWQYENLRLRAEVMMRQQVIWLQDRFKRARKQYEWRRTLNNWWNMQSEGQKLFYPILFINCLVFLAWKVPRFQGTMLKYFCSNPGSSAVCMPMILSVFSHYSALHLFCNMFVLHSFSTGIVNILGKEQFVGLYLSSGVISSFASYLYKVSVQRMGLSLGASGAIMTMLAVFCVQMPHSTLSVIFLPMFTFTAGSALKGILLLDTAGVIMKWHVFDHAAHLGGTLFGIAWCYWGNKYIWEKREPFLKWWHNLRGPPQSS